MDLKTKENLFPEVFFKPDFEIDGFLSQCTQKSDLLTLRKDLKNYGTELYTVMVDILKTETESIINLAENLTNLSVTVQDLYCPISQLCEEIRSLYHAVNVTKMDFKEHLDKVEYIMTEENHLNLKIALISSSLYINNIVTSWKEEEDITTLERAVNEYSFHFLYLTELGLESVVLQNDIQNIATRLLELVNMVFLKSLNDKDEITILRCLRMYVNLVKQDVAEQCVRKNLVHPVLSSIFTQRNLDSHGQDVKPLYAEAIEYLNNELGPLLKILRGNSDMQGFNFIINSFWVEVDKQLRENLPNTTAPGNPELFQKRFMDTWNFLQEIANKSGDVNLFKSNSSFEDHMKRFNLPVYFEIIFQQISVKFENEMLIDPSIVNDGEWKLLISEKEFFKLKISEALWNSIKQCFHDSVFLSHVVDQILKLMMLLMSRYLKWFEAFLIKYKGNSGSTNIEQFIIFSLIDFKLLKTLTGPSQSITEYDNTIFKVIPNHIRPSLKRILEINVELLNKMYSKLQQQLIYFKVQQSSVHLQQVTSIPRLYRRTNRNIPTKPSNYVIETVFLIINLHNNFKTIMDVDIVTILDLIISQLGDQYLGLVQEVLHSVCKTEESLRRLKSRSQIMNDESVGHGSGDATSDEAKIREQIKKDVGYFVSELSPFSVSTSKAVLQRLTQESSYGDSK